MILFKEAASLSKHISKLREEGKSIGFAPTMGALHCGHISLIENSKAICDITVSSIFVNPTQFNDPKDFEKYPVTIPNDISALETIGCDVLFIPSVTEIYPAGMNNVIRYELGEIELLLEGRFRPGHFQGVCQVVHRLLDIVKPCKLFMGQKDYQQCIVVKRLVQLLNLPSEVITVGTYREASGLAMSSRNFRLSNNEKLVAAGIFKTLQYIKEHYTTTPYVDLENYATRYLLEAGFNNVDYVSIADAKTLQPTSAMGEGIKRVALIAAFIGDVRLIDNVLLDE